MHVQFSGKKNQTLSPISIKWSVEYAFRELRPHFVYSAICKDTTHLGLRGGAFITKIFGIARVIAEQKGNGPTEMDVLHEYLGITFQKKILL